MAARRARTRGAARRRRAPRGAGSCRCAQFRRGHRGRQIARPKPSAPTARLCASKATTARRPRMRRACASSRLAWRTPFSAATARRAILSGGGELAARPGGANAKASRRFACDRRSAGGALRARRARGAPLRRRRRSSRSCFLCPRAGACDSRMARSAEALKGEWLAALAHERRRARTRCAPMATTRRASSAFAQEHLGGAARRKNARAAEAAGFPRLHHRAPQ